MNFSMNIILKILNKTPQMKMIIEATKNNKRVNDLVNIIIKQIERYPYIKKHPIIFFRSFFEVTYLAIKYNLECMPNLLKDIDEKIKDNKKLSTDEYIDFIEIIIKKYELEEKIIEVDENDSKYIFISGQDVIFNSKNGTVSLYKEAFSNLKELVDQYEATIIVTMQTGGANFKEFIANEFSKIEIDDIIFAKTRGFINHKDIIKSQIKNIGIKKNNYVVFNRRKDLGKTIGEKLITCSGGINTENKLMAKQLFSY